MTGHARVDDGVFRAVWNFKFQDFNEEKTGGCLGPVTSKTPAGGQRYKNGVARGVGPRIAFRYGWARKPKNAIA